MTRYMLPLVCPVCGCDNMAMVPHPFANRVPEGTRLRRYVRCTCCSGEYPLPDHARAIPDHGQACFDRYAHAKLFHEKPLLALDFDGVLHRYSRGYHDASAYDPPTEGALEFVLEASKHFQICISSARALTETGRTQIHEWLRRYGFPDLPVEVAKPPAFLTIDDRVVRFDGTWPDPLQLLNYRPWNGDLWGEKA